MGTFCDAWEKLSDAWQLAYEQAWAAYQDNCCPAGAIILDEAGAIVSQGRNRVHAASTDMRELADTKLAHAALNSVAQIPTSTQHLPWSIYTTVEPCLMCMGAIVINGIEELNFGSHDFFGGATSADRAYPPALELWPTVHGPIENPVGSVFHSLYVAFHSWSEPTGAVARAYIASSPGEVERAQELASRIEKHRLNLGMPLADALNTLELVG